VAAKGKGNKICAAGKAWARRTFDVYPSAYANMAASKYCKDPNYAKGAKGKRKKK
jgi:mannose/cellobiose epimerase-like protein (N-acyl-D-glucosamine 2-epimerase family)